MKKRQRDKKIHDFLINALTPFTIDELIKKTGIPGSFDDKAEIFDILNDCIGFVFDGARYHPAYSILLNMPVRIQPTEYEVQQRILIPGHRILGFVPFGSECVDIDFIYNNKPVPRKELSLVLEELFLYTSLMDLDRIPAKNIEDIICESTEMRIDAVDLDAFYKEHKFKTGDTIIARLTEEHPDALTIAYDSLEHMDAQKAEIKKSDQLFLKALKKTLKETEPGWNTEKQLLYSYYYIDKTKWIVAGNALGRCLHNNKNIRVSLLSEGTKIFHDAKQDPEEFDICSDMHDDHIDNHFDSDADADLQSIDGILIYLRNFYNLSIVRALILNQLSEGRDYNYDSIQYYLFNKRTKPYMPADISKIFENLVRKEYDDLKEDFDMRHASVQTTDVRNKLLEMVREISQFLLSLADMNIYPEDLPKDELVKISSLLATAYSTLKAIENDQLNGEIDSNEIKKIDKLISNVHPQLPQIFDEIRNKIRQKNSN